MLRFAGRPALARAHLRGLVLAPLFAYVAGCNGWSSFCSDRMDCLKGNDADVDACEVQLDAEEDRASVAGCTETWDAVASCVQEKYACKGGQFTDDGACKKQNEDYAQCMQ